MIGTSRRGMSSRIAQLVLYAGALGLITTVAAASLKDKPAKGVTLAGTQWRIDPYRSDDPEEVLDKAQKQKDKEDEDRIGRRAGGADRDGGPWGGGEDSHGTWGGRSGVPGRPTDLPDGGSSRDPTGMPGGDRGGGYGRRSDRTSTDIDPTGGTQSASIQLGNMGGIRNEFAGQLAKNPDTLSFREVNDHVAVAEDKLETECTAGQKAPLSDSFGDGERSCGWDGRAWVVETTRGKHFSRTDRYELSKDGKTLTYSTIASGAGMPKVKIYRVYTIAPPDASR
jgi:hypothetical protein